MRVKLEFMSADNQPIERGTLGDEIIRAIDRTLNGASWEASGNGWIAQK